MIKKISFTIAASMLALATHAQAGVVLVGSQAAFNALGTITQNTNFDSYGPGFFFPGSPLTVGDLSFVQNGQNLIGGSGTFYNLSRNLITDNNVRGTTINIAGMHSLFGSNAGNFFSGQAANFVVTTNLGSYAFSPFVGTAVNQAPLTFVGFQAGAGETITSVAWSGNGATGLTDIQLGTTGGVPEPSAWALLILGMGSVGAAMRRGKKAVRYSFA